MSGRPTLPMWARVADGSGGFAHETVDAAGRAWRLWYVEDGSADDPCPAGWRFAPLDALDRISFLEHRGGRDLDLAAMRIDAIAAGRVPGFRRRLGRE